MKNRLFIPLMAMLVICLAIWVFKCQKNDTDNIPVTTIKQVDSVKTAEFKLQPQIDSLNNVNGELMAKDWLNKKKLAFLQSENRRLAKLAEAHIDSMGLYEPPDSNENDYEGNVKEIIANAAASDSVCNETIKNLDSTIVIAAKTMTLKDSLYNSIKQSFNTSIEQQTRQERYILTLKKQAKTRGIVNKVLGGVALILIGVAIGK